LTSTSSAAAFAAKWKGRGDEKQDCHPFWIELLQKVYGVQDAASFCRFEVPVMLKHKSFIDVYLPHTRVLIEQKSAGINLAKPEKQSDGTSLTPYEQGKRYADVMPFSERPRWIIACNFTEFWVYDQEKPNDDPQRIALADLPKEAYRMNFLTDVSNSSAAKEMELSRDAGELVGRIYNALLPAYGEHPSKKGMQDLNKFIVRLVFCFYAEDAELFGKRNMFHDYMESFQPEHFRKGLMDLFEILDTKEEDRIDPFEEEKLLAFPYVNGSLFTEKTPIPPIDDATRRLILEDGCGFDWANISPTIFGSIFEGTLNPDIRRQGGMHYTSLENIHKVIDPLFVNEYRAKFQRAMSIKQPKTRATRLRELQEELSRGRFFDPACGSGNFLTESYLTLRRLENDILRETDAAGGAILLGMNFDEPSKNDFIKVNIQQFYGIEINDFACAVAKTALWIAESQMFKETLVIVNKDMDFLPLSTNANIHEGNALQMDWKEVLPPSNDVRIMGNPPFVGNSHLTAQQKEDRKMIFSGNGGKLDYVACWYRKAFDYMKGHHIIAAFVSTNSICQGQQVAPLWGPLYKDGLRIHFAYRTFIWNSDSLEKAHVYCVVIGFAAFNSTYKTIYDEAGDHAVSNINGYLMDAPDIYVKTCSRPICDVPPAIYGIKPADNHNLILEEEERVALLKKHPEAQKWIRAFISADPFINGEPRWCLWLEGITPAELQAIPEIRQRVEACREWRSRQIKTGDAYKLRNMPTMMRPSKKFHEGKIFVFPRHTGESREYIPFGYANDGDIPSDSVEYSLEIEPYHFGILESNVHMAWMRFVSGRLESRYRYAINIVYNTFPWPSPTESQRRAIENTAQRILDARAQYKDSSLVQLYTEALMPIELRKAHEANDRAVMAAYGFRKDMPESEIVIELLKMYQEITQKS